MAIDIPHAAGGSYPLRAGNAVRPWVDGVPAFRRIGEAIEAARHSLWLTVAFFRPDFRMPDSRQSLFKVLDGAAARGLDAASALRLYRQIPFHNRCRRDAGEADWRGLAFCLDPATYAM